MKLMLKWPNLYYSTSAFAPKHYPEEIIKYANTRGADKVMYGSDYPHDIGDMKGCLERVDALPPDQRDAVRGANAARIFDL